MSERALRALRAAATTLLLVWATPTPAEEIAGSYVLKGNVGAGSYYDGALTIRPGGAAFDLDWQYADADPAKGYALRLDDVIGGVFAEEGAGVGIVLYRVRGGELDGVWNGFGNYSGSIGRETLSGGKGLAGTYEVTLGLNPDNSRYTGAVTIRRSGEVYLVDWAVPRITYIGTGVLVGDVFVVAYAAAHRPRVWAYCVAEQVWTGVVSIADSDRITAEIMWPAGRPAPADAEARLATLREGPHINGCGEVPVASLTQTWR